MQDLIRKTKIVFSRAFTVPGFHETLPPGEYDIETELCAPPDHLDPEKWKASVLVHLHTREAHPGLARTLTLSLADLDSARAKDKLSGSELAQLFLDEMLADPMVRLVMQADGISEEQVRHLYSGLQLQTLDGDRRHRERQLPLPRALERSSIEAAENEGWPTGSDVASRE